MTTDVTIEALAELLSGNPRGVALVRDEMAAWMRGMGEYKVRGRGADRPHWLSLWSSSSICVNRRSLDEPIFIDKPYVSVAGCIQPDLLNEFDDERGQEDGFIHRILFSYPETSAPMWTDAELCSDVVDDYIELFQSMRALPVSNIPGEEISAITMSPEARECFVGWVRAHQAEIPDLPSSLRGPWSKMVAYCARFALILHVAKEASDGTFSSQVGPDAVSSAVQLAEYFKSHARKVYSKLHVDARSARVALAVGWISLRPGKEASRRDIVTAGVAGCRDSKSADALFQALEDAGWGKTVERKPKGGGRSSVVFQLG